MGGKKVFELLLEVGFKSQPLKSILPNGYTHKWTIFVRGANNNKVELCIQRVVFQLHESFSVPYREVTSPPYQVKETGYAGFFIPIEVFFKSRDKTNRQTAKFNLDLCLLNDRPNSQVKLEKVKFFNPTKELEKCLIKSGAQLISITKDKKERSSSPPAKRQKSSSLIPSKDMCKQATVQSHSLSQTRNNHSHSPTPQNYIATNTQSQNHNHSRTSHSLNQHGHTKSSNGGSGNSLFSHSSQQNNHQSTHDNDRHHQSSSKTSSQHQAGSMPKTKSSSREFIDVFGAPLVYNNSKNHKSNGCKDSDNHSTHAVTRDRSPLPPITQQKTSSLPNTQSHSNQIHNLKSSHHQSHNQSNHQNQKSSHSKPHSEPKPVTPQAPQKLPSNQTHSFTVQTDPFITIQHKISSLTDCDRLQKIVDIIEEAGEWFNLTPNKFEFDLKRLDKKTLHRIEKCLQL